MIPPDPDLLTPEEFVARFASWFDMPTEILTGTPSETSRDAAARALHSEISKSSSKWFRALASRQVGTIGNWAIVLGFAASLVRQAANQMGAANVVNPAPAQEKPQEEGAAWPPKA